MKRRQFLQAAASASLALPMSAKTSKPTILELRWMQMRNTADDEAARTTEFLRESAAPAFRQAGVKVAGAFRTAIGPGSPSFLLISEYADLAAFEAVSEKVWSDAAFRKAYVSYTAGAPRVYEREETSLLKSFDGMPAMTVPAPREGGGNHIFELRRYESTNGVTLERKVKMFNEGEMGIFQRLGMKPVFFGTTTIGTNMPNLVYMLCFDSLAERERLWGKFVSDPEWKKISSPPELHDSQVVTNISNWILDPLDFSGIR